MDAFLLFHALPPEPRLYFLGSREAVARRPLNRALAIDIFGGMVPVATEGQLNREALEVALAILADGASLGIFPEGADLPNLRIDGLGTDQTWVAFLALRSGRRVLPVGLPNSRELWRGRSLEDPDWATPPTADRRRFARARGCARDESGPSARSAPAGRRARAAAPIPPVALAEPSGRLTAPGAPSVPFQSACRWTRERRFEPPRSTEGETPR